MEENGFAAKGETRFEEKIESRQQGGAPAKTIVS